MNLGHPLRSSPCAFHGACPFARVTKMRLCVLIVCVLCFNYGLCVRNRKNTRDTSRPNGVAAAVGYYERKHARITIPIMIHLDREAIAKHPDIKKYRRQKSINNYFEKVFADVEELYRRPSLNITVKLKLMDVRILKKNNTKLLHENVSEYLKSYCTWQGKMKSRRHTLWYSVLFTGYDLFYLDGFGKEVRSSTGRGYMKGICSTNNSCTLLEFRPNHIAYILAHEMAHSMGVSHDGPPYNDCKPQRHIMDPLFDPHKPAKTWSSCSRRNLRQFLTSPRASCLLPEGKHPPL